MARILSIARSSGSLDDPVLVQVKSSSNNTLDLQLAATEGSNPYSTTLRDKNIQNMRTKNYKGDRAEWAAVLSWKLLGMRPDQQFDEFVRSVELVASVDEAKSIKLTFRQAVSGITQQLGSLSLDYSEQQEIALFDWTDTAVQAAARAEAESENLARRLRAKEDAIATLRNKLEELIVAKDESETHLLEKAMRLINSKKLKIRDQQRLLATAKVDQAALDRLAGARQAEASNAVRRGKRRASDPPQEDSKDDESSDGFEPMDVDKPRGRVIPADSEDEQEIQKTPEPSDQDTDDDDDGAGPPPRQALPFVHSDSASTQSKTAPVSRDDDDETTDDEL